MSYTIKVEKTLMHIALAQALPRQQQCARECSLQAYRPAEGGAASQAAGCPAPGDSGARPQEHLSPGARFPRVLGASCRRSGYKFQGVPKILVIKISSCFSIILKIRIKQTRKKKKTTLANYCLLYGLFL